jgi:hypothetical protein
VKPALTFAALLVAAPAMAQDRKAEIEQIVFELCPKLLDGTMDLTNPAQAQSIGFTPTEPRDTPGGKIPRAVKGNGTGTIVLSGQSGADASCGFWFGGPDNAKLLKSLLKRTRAEGLKGGSAGRLGDGTEMFFYNGTGDKPRTLTIIAGDAGGEIDFEPATTIVMSYRKN